LIALVKREYGIKCLDDLLRRHLDPTLNIAHGGITLDTPEALRRDHIFPKSKLEKAGYPYELVNHYANFHFLRGIDNLNKLDKDPHEWFKNPGKNVPPYSDKDLDERLTASRATRLQKLFTSRVICRSSISLPVCGSLFALDDDPSQSIAAFEAMPVDSTYWRVAPRPAQNAS
jgi:hypothetical protein